MCCKAKKSPKNSSGKLQADTASESMLGGGKQTLQGDPTSYRGQSAFQNPVLRGKQAPRLHNPHGSCVLQSLGGVSRCPIVSNHLSIPLLLFPGSHTRPPPAGRSHSRLVLFGLHLYCGTTLSCLSVCWVWVRLFSTKLRDHLSLLPVTELQFVVFHLVLGYCD